MTLTWAELTDFWEPGQPRDSRGRWTDMGRATATYKGRHTRAREMVGRATSRADAEEALRHSYGLDPEDNMPSVGHVSLYGLHDDTAIKVATRLVELNEKYPGAVINNIAVARLHPEIGARVLMPGNMSGPSPVKLEFNATINENFGKENPGFLNGSGIDYATTHEYGHIIHANIAGDYNMKPRGKEKSRYREASKWVEEYEQYTGHKLTPADMSEYSHEGGPMELVAEGFADVEINGDSARASSKYFHGRLVAAYNERLSGQQAAFSADLVELFYSPTQPRDGNGRWSKGGGGVGSGRAAGYKRRAGESELDAITKHMRPQLTDAEMEAIRDLKVDAGADAVNYYHREVVGTSLEQKYANEKSMVQAKATSEALDQVFADLPPIEQELTLYRGFRDAGEGYLPQNLAGQELVDDGYMFVTADRDVAKYYAEQTEGKTLIMQMKAPPGTKVLPFWALHESHVDDVTGEYTSKEAYAEMLLPRGTKVTVDNVFSMGGGVTASARIS